MTKTIVLVLLTFTMITSGCTSARTYFAPTAEDRARWDKEEEARNNKAKEDLLGGPFGELLGAGAVIGSMFK